MSAVDQHVLGVVVIPGDPLGALRQFPPGGGAHFHAEAGMYGVLVSEQGGSLTRADLIERAYQLARTGLPRRIEDVIAALDREGYPNARAHLEGPAIRHSLRKIWNRARLDDENV